MGNTSGFYMIVENEKELDKKFKLAGNIVKSKPYCLQTNPLVLNLIKGTKERMTFDLTKEKEWKTSMIRCWSRITLNSEEGEGVLDVASEIIPEVDPIFGIDASENIGDNFNYGCFFEYYQNPYYFCIEPITSAETIKTTKENEVFKTYPFLNDKKTLQKLKEIEKVMPREELMNLLKKYSKKVVLSKQGVGVLKGAPASEKKPIVSSLNHVAYPRYFIRKILRERGIKLDEGSAEFEVRIASWPKEPKEKCNETFNKEYLKFKEKCKGKAYL